MNSTIGLITARGGSKGLPKKNTMDLCGKPLIAYTIEAALAAPIDRVILSTDDEEIARIASVHGADVPFMRPAELATDSATSLDVILHAAHALGLDDAARIVLLQPTSPLRTGQDLCDAIALHDAHHGEASVVSVTRAVKPLAWHHTMSDSGVLAPRFPELVSARRQDAAPLYLPNGAIYIATVAAWRAGNLLDGALAYEMPESRSIDIDTALDFAMARWLMERDHGAPKP